jgi:primosomal protein N' (replication factor Y) (superfamily II helicase)
VVSSSGSGAGPAAVRSARDAAVRVAAGVGEAVGTATEVLGPAPLFRLRGRDRWQLVVKTAERGVAVSATAAAVEAAARDRALRAVAFSVDVDPQ